MFSQQEREKERLYKEQQELEYQKREQEKREQERLRRVQQEREQERLRREHQEKIERLRSERERLRRELHKDIPMPKKPIDELFNKYNIETLSTTTDIQEIKQLYRSMAKQLHPDKNKGNEENSTLEFKLLKNWYDGKKEQLGFTGKSSKKTKGKYYRKIKGKSHRKTRT